MILHKRNCGRGVTRGTVTLFEGDGEVLTGNFLGRVTGCLYIPVTSRVSFLVSPTVLSNYFLSLFPKLVGTILKTLPYKLVYNYK